MNYFAWQIRPAAPDAEQALAAAGYGVLRRRVLAARGCADAEAACRLLEPEQGLSDPFLLKDMDRAVALVSPPRSEDATHFKSLGGDVIAHSDNHTP